MPIHLRITHPGSLLPVLADRDIPETIAEQIVALLGGEVYGDEPPVETLIPARSLGVNELIDIAVTAAEGGIGYWSLIVSDYDYTKWSEPDSTTTRRDLPDDFVIYRLRYENPESDDPQYLEVDVTPELIRRGVQLVVASPSPIRKDLADQVLDAVRGDPDDVDIDADAADCIVQLGIFKEVVFG